MRNDKLSVSMPRIVAHRGASAIAPENTLAAFRLARTMGADAFELDCSLSADDCPRVLHDAEVNRTTSGKGRAHDLPLATLRTFDAGSWKDAVYHGERIPLLEEALALADEHFHVLIEIKAHDDEARLLQAIDTWAGDVPSLNEADLARLVRQVDAEAHPIAKLTRIVIDRVRTCKAERCAVIQSFSALACAIALHESPDIRTEFLGADHPVSRDRWEEYLRLGYLLGVAGFNISLDSVTPGRLAAFHAASRSVAVWTVDKEEDMRCLCRWGVDAIITNEPDVCRSVLQSMNLQE